MVFCTPGTRGWIQSERHLEGEVVGLICLNSFTNCYKSSQPSFVNIFYKLSTLNKSPESANLDALDVLVVAGIVAVIVSCCNVICCTFLETMYMIE